MANTFSHHPSRILQQLLVDLSLGTLPSSDGSWPVWVEDEQDRPDNGITVQLTQGVGQGSLMQTGELLGTLGFQVRIRTNDRSTGWAKADAIQTDLAALAARNVTISATVYNVWDVLPDDVLYIGTDVPGGRRQLFTINMTATLDQR